MKLELRKEQTFNGDNFYKVYLNNALVYDSVIYAGNEDSTEEQKALFLKKAMEIYENIKNKKKAEPQVLLSEDI